MYISSTSSNNVGNIFIVDYACGFHPGICNVDYVSELRSKAAIRALKRYPGAYILLGAGMSYATCGCGSLSQMIDYYLLQHGIPRDKILINDKGYNTITESEAAYEIISSIGMGKVICATTRYHAPRVWLIWLFRFGIVPQLFISNYRLPFNIELHEYAKIVPEIFRSIYRRFKVYSGIKL